jgi:hypothetical protein
MAIELDGVYGVTSDGNVTTGNYFIGNGAFLTSVTSSYNDANVAALLASGNITVANITTVNAAAVSTTSLIAYGNTAITNLNATGNIATGNILTDGYYYANGVPVSFSGTYGDSNVAAYLPTYTGALTQAVGFPKSTVQNSSATSLTVTQQVTTFSAPATVTVTLPPIDSSTIGVQYTIVDTWGGGRGPDPIDIFVNDTGTETIDGVTTVQLTADYGVFVVMCVSATEWIVISN